MKLLSHLNTFRVLRAIWLNKEISRIKIAKKLGLDKSTVSNIVSHLLELGVVKTTEEGTSSPLGGRKPIYLTLHKDFGCVLGIEIQPDSYKVVVINANGKILFTQSAAVTISCENLIERFLVIVDLVTREVIEPKKLNLIGIGIGISGIVNPQSGDIYQSIPLNITSTLNFYNEISGKIDVPVFIENDANCCCWGELAIHRRERLQHFIFVLEELRDSKSPYFKYQGTSIGIGIVINGKVYYGNEFSAGEFKSILWQSNNLSQFSTANEQMSSIEQDKETFLNIVKELALHIALFVNTFNLSHIFLGGFMENYESEIVTIIKGAIQNNWAYTNKVNCKVQFTTTGDLAVAYGAAAMYLEKFFSVPEIHEDKQKRGKFQLDMLEYIYSKQSKCYTYGMKSK
jgi:predicted NBD/HSP70 family sugar kinase